MKIKYLFSLFVVLTVLTSLIVLAEDPFVYETGMDPYYDTYYADTYTDYSAYSTSPEGTYMNPSYDFSGYDFSSFDDWDNLNLANPSLDLTSIDNDQFKNIVGRDDWQDYDNVIDNFNTRVSESPTYVNSDKEMMDSWLSSFTSDSASATGISCSPNCAIKSYDKETGQVETMSVSSYEGNMERYGEEAALAGTKSKVTFNINDPLLDGAIITDDGYVVTPDGGPLVKGGSISVVEGETSSDPKSYTIDCTGFTSGGVELDGTEYDRTTVIDGSVSKGSLYIASFPEGDKHTQFEVNGDTIIILEGSELSQFTFQAVDYAESGKFLSGSGDIEQITINGDEIILAGGSYGFSYETANERRAHRDEFHNYAAYEAQGTISFDINDLDFESDNVLSQINLGEDSKLIDFTNGFSTSVDQPTYIIYQQDGCNGIGNCVELYEDESMGGIMTVSVEDNNQIDISLTSLETDSGWLGNFEVEPISNDCDDCRVTLNDNNKVRLEFSNQEPVAQGDISLLTVGTIHTYYDGPETNTIDGVDVTEITQHTHTISNQESTVCSNCRTVGIVRSEDVDLSAEEILEYSYFYAVRTANDPAYGSRYGGMGSYMYGEGHNEHLSEGSRLSTVSYYQKFERNKLTQYSFGCINLVEHAVELSVGDDSSRLYSSELIAEKVRSQSEDFKTEYVTTYSTPLPKAVTEDSSIEVVRFETADEVQEYLAEVDRGAPFGYYGHPYTEEGELDYGQVKEKHTGIKGMGYDTIEAHVYSDDITVTEDKISGLINPNYGGTVGVMVTSIRDTETVEPEPVIVESEPIIDEDLLLADLLDFDFSDEVDDNGETITTN